MMERAHIFSGISHFLPMLKRNITLENSSDVLISHKKSIRNIPSSTGLTHLLLHISSLTDVNEKCFP